MAVPRPCSSSAILTFVLQALWPGDSESQRKQLNAKIDEVNDTETPQRKVKHVEEDEWWTFWGVIIFAAKVGVGGLTHLYAKGHKVIPQLPHVNLSDIMKEYRAKQLLQLIPSAFHGNDLEDPWNAVRPLIDGFNSNRAQRVAASHCKILDEAMSAWKPRTSRLGGLPFLSFILRKPKPLGTEFKVMACSETGKYEASHYSTILITTHLTHCIHFLLQTCSYISRFKRARCRCGRGSIRNDSEELLAAPCVS